MKMEDHFKETLNRAVANEPPVLEAWDRFEQRAGRARRVRWLAAIAAAAAVAIASVIVVPRLGTGGGIGLSTQEPSPSPTPTQTVDPYAGWKSYDYDLYRFKIRHPADWRVVVFEANPEILAPGQVATASGEPTMAVTLALVSEEFDAPTLREEAGFDRSTRPDGRPFVWVERDLDGGGRLITYRLEWSTCVTGVTPPGCTRNPETLVVQIHAGTRALWNEHGADAERIVTSIEYDGPVGPYSPGECDLTPEQRKTMTCA